MGTVYGYTRSDPNKEADPGHVATIRAVWSVEHREKDTLTLVNDAVMGNVRLSRRPGWVGLTEATKEDTILIPDSTATFHDIDELVRVVGEFMDQQVVVNLLDLGIRTDTPYGCKIMGVLKRVALFGKSVRKMIKEIEETPPESEEIMPRRGAAPWGFKRLETEPGQMKVIVPDLEARSLGSLILSLHDDKMMSWQGIAQKLNQMGERRKGGLPHDRQSVVNIHRYETNLRKKEAQRGSTPQEPCSQKAAGQHLSR